jgi:hypothetical protein
MAARSLEGAVILGDPPAADAQDSHVPARQGMVTTRPTALADACPGGGRDGTGRIRVGWNRIAPGRVALEINAYVASTLRRVCTVSREQTMRGFMGECATTH